MKLSVVRRCGKTFWIAEVPSEFHPRYYVT